jgi:hypothetical protein
VLIGSEATSTDCDAPGGTATFYKDGKCLCVVCSRCKRHTGNSNQGHFWAFCSVTKQMEAHHFCCPDKCELTS